MGGRMLHRHQQPGWLSRAEVGKIVQACLCVHVCNLFSCMVGGRWLRFHKLYLTDNYTKTNCALPYPSPCMATSRFWGEGCARQQGAAQ